MKSISEVLDGRQICTDVLPNPERIDAVLKQLSIHVDMYAKNNIVIYIELGTGIGKAKDPYGRIIKRNLHRVISLYKEKGLPCEWIIGVDHIEGSSEYWMKKKILHIENDFNNPEAFSDIIEYVRYLEKKYNKKAILIVYSDTFGKWKKESLLRRRIQSELAPEHCYITMYRQCIRLVDLIKIIKKDMSGYVFSHTPEIAKKMLYEHRGIIPFKCIYLMIMERRNNANE